MNDLNPYQHIASYYFDESPDLVGHIGGKEYYECDEDWHCTAEGGAWGEIRIREKHFYPERMVFFENEGVALSVLLQDTEEVATWVNKLAVEQPPCTVSNPIISCQLISATVLAIYPGYFTPSDSEARRCTVLNSFFDGLRVSSGECAGLAFVSFINRMASNGRSNSLYHAMRWMPAQFVALLAAHGMSIRREDIWGERWEEALISGTVYQLTHPAEKYYEGMITPWIAAQIPLILRLEPKIMQAVFKLSGLTQKDVLAAKQLALSIDPTEGHDYVSLFLHYLNGKMTLLGGIGADVPLELPILC